jgi:hypothetical protein
LLGLPVEAGVLGALFLTFNAMFQHMGMKTPRWLGYIILHHSAPGKPQRPSWQRHPPLQLLGPAALGHGVRHLSKPARVSARARFLPRRVWTLN